MRCLWWARWHLHLLYFNKAVLEDLGIDLLEAYPEGMNYQEILSLYRQAVEEGALEEGAPLGKYLSPTSFDAFENLNYLDRGRDRLSL